MSSSRSPCTVVVVDDDDAIREVIAGAIRGDGYRVITAANGVEALEVLETLVRPCVVLLDLMMPIKSGWDVIHEMERRPLLASIPVVVLTACNEYASGSSDLGRPVVQKPIDCDALLSLVDELCSQEERLFETMREPPKHLIPGGPYVQRERRGAGHH